MIVWSGRGFLLVIVFIISMILFVNILPDQYSDLSFVLAFFITGAFAWFIGKKWNEVEGRTMIDKASGQEITITPNHSLFWIKMQYWGPICGILGLIILIQNLI